MIMFLLLSLIIFSIFFKLMCFLNNCHKSVAKSLTNSDSNLTEYQSVLVVLIAEVYLFKRLKEAFIQLKDK